MPPAETSARRKALRDQLLTGAKLFQTAHYEQARQQFELARKGSLNPPDSYIETRAISNIGGCWFALHQYKLALRYFLDAETLARTNSDSNLAHTLEANIASLYSEIGERDAAVFWLERSLAGWKDKDRGKNRSQLEFEMASLRARQNRLTEARELFHKGISRARRDRNAALEAVGLNKMGEEMLRTGDVRSAEAPLLQAYYIRRLNRLPLQASYTNLGKLRLAQGDLESAAALLDQAVKAFESAPGAMPPWEAYLGRGEVRLAQSRYRDALSDLRVALRLARAWRWSLPADDASHIGAEGVLDRVYSAFVEAGNRLYLETGDEALIRETFETSEENRAMSLRMLVQDRQEQAADLPPAYWEAVARLQRAEVAALRGGGAQAVEAARANWIRQEASLAPDLAPLPAESMEKIRASLDSGTALLSLRLGDSASWIWAVDRDRVELRQLPPRADIQSLAARAGRAIRESQPDSEAPAQLYRILFGELDAPIREKDRWLLALDPALLDLPVAALQVSTGPRPVFLLERHVVQIIPGSAFWLESAAARPRASAAGLFVGVGDPIYNSADPRLKPGEQAGRAASRWALFAGARPQNAGIVLPRLVGSAAEVEQCARVWKGESVLLRGREASEEKVRQAIQGNPAVVHFALHFLQSAEPRPHGLMALSLGRDKKPELITPLEVSHWRARAGLVVLSGCDSAAAEALPGAGLMGLTRAWLTAGVRSVLASRWATPDEEGAIFTAFYREYAADARPDAAAALRRAQTSMIRAGGWRAQPAYWGAWFVVGN